MRRIVSIFIILAILAASLPAVSKTSAAGEETYIIILADPPLSRYGGGIAGLAPTDPEVTGDLRLDVDSPASVAYLNYLQGQQDSFIAAMNAALGRTVVVLFRYNTVLNGLAANLTTQEAAVVAGLPGVRRVEKDQQRFLLTDAGPAWMGAGGIWDGSATGGLPGTQGEGVVVGIIDTGVNHDHPAFAATGPGDGYAHSNPRSRFFGACDPVTGAPFCNNKLIGFYDFTGTTPEDTNGHGSHTASTTAGNVLDAQMVAPTTTVERRISGVAPHANIISYKVCITSCPISAILAAVNQSALDEVDVVNFSIGGDSSDPWSDLDSQAFLNARNAGVFASVSAGNDGPGAATIGSPADAPWVLTVGASTHDRKFTNILQNLSGGATAPPGDLAGKSVTSGYGPASIVYAGDFGDPLCQTPFLPGTWANGEIVVCDRGVNPRVEKASNVASGGAGGFVLANEEASGDSTVADAYAIPGVNITYNDGLTLKAWLASGSGHTASISGTQFNVASANGDVMAAFSSRGPNPADGGVLKPDVTAPGVDILAAVNTTNPLVPPEYGVLSGTSMSSPHSAGAAALLRALHPDWTPDQVKSALVTTGFTTLPGTGSEAHGVLKEDGANAADPFDYGGGRVDLRQAGKAGLILNEATSNYNAANPGAGGDPKTLNLPSLADPNCLGSCSWTRTVQNALGVKMNWRATISAPAGLAVRVTPKQFILEPGASQTIQITADVNALSANGWHFAQVILVPRDKSVPETRLPVAVNRSGGGVQVRSLHFHGNAHDGCSGIGAVDIGGCGGPFLREDANLDTLSPAAAAFGPVPVALDCTVPRCEVDPNFIWNLAAPTTLRGPMTVEWWIASPATSLLFFDDFSIRLWADGQLVLDEVVRHNVSLPGVPTWLRSSVLVPEVTASSNFVLVVDPIFINQDQSILYYDSTKACPGGTQGPCDSLVQMPVVVRR